MEREVIKEKLHDLVKESGDDALLPSALLELMNAQDGAIAHAEKLEKLIVATAEKTTGDISALSEQLKKSDNAAIAHAEESAGQISVLNKKLFRNLGAICVVLVVLCGFVAWKIYVQI